MKEDENTKIATKVKDAIEKEKISNKINKVGKISDDDYDSQYFDVHNYILMELTYGSKADLFDDKSVKEFRDECFKRSFLAMEFIKEGISFHEAIKLSLEDND
jgi:hypothetical protein